MSDMGTFRVGIAIQHPARGGTEERIDDVLVDTGSEITWIPNAGSRESRRRTRTPSATDLRRGGSHDSQTRLQAG